MRSLAIALCCCLALSVIYCTQEEAGPSVSVDDWYWVSVEENISNENIDFARGEPCGIKVGGFITVIGVRNGQLLVRYTYPRAAAGTSCPNGTIGTITTHDFSDLTTDRPAPVYKRVVPATDANDTLIIKLAIPE